MIAVAKLPKKTQRRATWQAGFMALLPDLFRYARQAFRSLRGEARNEAIQEVIVSAMLAYLRLYQRDKEDVAYASVLARYAIAQYHDGRRVAAQLNCQDVLSAYARRLKGIQVESLDRRDMDGESWREIVVEDRHAGPAETAAVRVDFAAWLALQTGRDRKIAGALAEGSTTQEVAKRFRVTPGRISQKRRELLNSWRKFQGEYEEAAARRVAS